MLKAFSTSYSIFPFEIQSGWGSFSLSPKAGHSKAGYSTGAAVSDSGMVDSSEESTSVDSEEASGEVLGTEDSVFPFWQATAKMLSKRVALRMKSAFFMFLPPKIKKCAAEATH